MSDPARTQRHLVLLDELTEVGMLLVHRLCDGEPRPGQDQLRDFQVLCLSVRRSILLSHLIETDALPRPRQAPASAPPERDRSAAPPAPPRADDRTRLDRLEKPEDVSRPFEETVASIVRDIRTVLATIPAPPADAPADHHPGPEPRRGITDLNADTS